MTEREMARKKAAARKERERKARNRRVVTTIALMLVVCVASIGGTIAWLTDSSDAVTNTFSPSGIDIDLAETANQTDGTWSAKLVPGMDYAKDPVVSVNRDITDVDVYLFVKFEELNNTDLGSGKGKILVFDSTLDDTNSGWTRGTGDSGDGVPTDVWYRTVLADETEPSWQLLAGKGDGEFKKGFVTVNENLTKEEMPDGTTTDPTPELKYTAYAIQTHGMSSIGDAWSKVNPGN